MAVARSNLAVGIAMGALFGLLGAIVAAAVSMLVGGQFALTPILVGIGIAFGMSRFGHTRGVVPGLIAAFIALVFQFLVVFVVAANSIAKYFDASFLDSLRAVVESPGDVVSIYFSDGPAYLCLALTAGIAFFYANGGKFHVLGVGFAFDSANGGRAAKAEKAARAQQQGAATNESLNAAQNETPPGA